MGIVKLCRYFGIWIVGLGVVLDVFSGNSGKYTRDV